MSFSWYWVSDFLLIFVIISMGYTWAVALFTSAWIETRPQEPHEQLIPGRALHERVD